jgi:hypothetical protein
MFLSARNSFFWRCTLERVGFWVFSHVPTGQEECETLPFGRQEKIVAITSAFDVDLSRLPQAWPSPVRSIAVSHQPLNSENPVVIALLLHYNFSNAWRGLPLFLLFMFLSLWSSTFVDASFLESRWMEKAEKLLVI